MPDWGGQASALVFRRAGPDAPDSEWVAASLAGVTDPSTRRTRMSNGNRDAKYYFIDIAGTRFSTKGYFSEHKIKLRIKEGGKWGSTVEIGPGERYAYAVTKGVSEIEIKSDIVGWPKAEVKLPATVPTYSPEIIVTEHENKVGFDFACVEDVGPVLG
jgi:hypothetical protein